MNALDKEDPSDQAGWTLELITSRQNISPKRLIAPRPSEDQICDMFRAAASAPDHGETAPWRFVLVPQSKRTLIADVFIQALIERDAKAKAEQIEKAREKAFRSSFLALAIARIGTNEPNIDSLERMLSAIVQSAFTVPALTRIGSSSARDIPLIECTPGSFFDEIAGRLSEQEALVSVHQGRRYSYRALQVGVNQLACAMVGLRLPPGDRVGIWSQNSSQRLLMQQATAKAGLVLVNINPAYRVSEPEYALNDWRARRWLPWPASRQAITLACCWNWPPIYALTRKAHCTRHARRICAMSSGSMNQVRARSCHACSVFRICLCKANPAILDWPRLEPPCRPLTRSISSFSGVPTLSHRNVVS